MTTAQNNTKGILFILVGMVVFSIQDALIKFIYEDSALYELYLGRTLSAAFFLFCYMKFAKQKIILKTHYPFLTTLRIICFFFGFSFFYISLTYMSLAMANALYIGATIISILFFIFTGKGQFNNFSDPTFQFIFREWFTNPTYAWPIIILMGFIGALAFFCVFNAYSIASPSVVSLYEYSLIIWSIMIGYILFDNVPTLRTFIGVSIIIGAGIYIYLREKIKDQMIVTDTPNR